jgi:hypothetical protein
MRLTTTATDKFRVEFRERNNPEAKFWVGHLVPDVKVFVERHINDAYSIDSVLFYTEYIIDIAGTRQRITLSDKFGLVTFTLNELLSITEDQLDRSRKLAKAEFDRYTTQQFGCTLKVTNSSDE